MVLLVGGHPLVLSAGQSHGVLDYLLASAEVQRAVADFLEQLIIRVPPEAKSVHVFQGEAAAAPLGGAYPVQYLGSSDATTCVICLLVDHQAGLATVGHYDNGTVGSAASLGASLEGMAAPQLWVVGGYSDTRGAGRAAVARLLAHYHSTALPITLRLCCVADLNNDPSGAPCCQSLALHLPTLAAAPADWSAQRGPLPLPRLAQLWLREEEASRLQNVYDRARNRFSLRLIEGAPNPRLARYLQYLLRIEDTQELLRLTSTSPEHEGPGFLEDMRGAWTWLLEQRGAQQVVARVFEWRPQHGWQEVGEEEQQEEAVEC